MAINLITKPAVEPILLAGAKKHLRVEVTDDDNYITSLIVVAREHVETITRRALITQIWELGLDNFPSGEISLPLPPLQSVGSVKYTDTDGVVQTLGAEKYTVDIKNKPGVIVPAYGKSWPATRDVINAVLVTFTAGYGNAGADVPEPIKQAMLFLIAHFYENREAVASGTVIREIPLAVESLLATYRVWS